MFPVDVQIHDAVTGRPTAPCPDGGAAGGAGDAGDGVVGPGLAAAIAGEDHDPSPGLAERAATSRMASRASRTVSKPITPQSS